jgi:hypothetical protein
MQNVAKTWETIGWVKRDVVIEKVVKLPGKKES